MVQRKTYDTRVKYLVMKGLLPDLYRKQIHKSLISKWKRESPDKYIYFVMDNFSRYITSWRIADKVCAKVRIETFEETIINAGIEPNQKQTEKTELIVDRGTENNNIAVTTLLQK